MWHEIQINENSWFLQTTIDAANKVEVLLFNLTDVLCENVEFANVFTRVKQLNKRIQYDEDTVRSTLHREKPTEATLTVKDEQYTELKLIYRLGIRRLIVEWHLRKQTSSELIQTLVLPLFKNIHDLWVQNETLRSAVLKKDEEIKQYRLEHGQLRRNTIATKIFDFAAFDEKHKHTMEWCEYAKKVGAFFTKQNVIVATTADAKVDVKEEIKDEKPIRLQTNNQPKISPRNRKRQFKAQYEQMTEKNLRARKMRFEYEALSDSQSSGEHKLLPKNESSTNIATENCGNSMKKDVFEFVENGDKVDLNQDPCSSATYNKSTNSSKNKNKLLPNNNSKSSATTTTKTTDAVIEKDDLDVTLKPQTPNSLNDKTDQADQSRNKTSDKLAAARNSKCETVSKPNKSKTGNEPPQSELSAEVDAILRELQELEQRRISDMKQQKTT